MFTITKQFHFSASHQLAHLRDDHQCARLHGHNYRVEVVLRSEVLDSAGFILDYGELAPFKEYLDSTFDHRHLNDVLGGSHFTTAEKMAWHLYQFARNHWPQVAAVRVSETDKTWAEYSE